MAKVKLQRIKSRPNLVNLIWDTVKNLLFNFDYIPVTCILILCFECVLNILVIWRVNYTEIDWTAYMQEVEGVLNGTLDYSELKGDTGPLVYPAGFVYIFSSLYVITNKGENIKLAQYLFALFYLLTLYLVYRIYYATKKVPPYVLLIGCCISYRIHSIFVLRLFNDTIAMVFLYLSINLFLSNKWTLGSIAYSFAVSIKMNVLLYSPALLIAYLVCLGVKNTVAQLSVCAVVQIALGLPFMLVNFKSYMSQSFNLGRVFLYQWTVNWRFLPENVFLSRHFHFFLLVIHILLLLIFSFNWHKLFQSYATLKYVERKSKSQLKKYKQTVNMSTIAQLFILPMFTCNFIGVMCSRSLHYQFYVWYYHTLPYLLWCTPYSNIVRLTILGIIELCWNTYPSTALSSISLHVFHIAILYGVYKTCKK